jgi:hypothetical protein
MRLVFGVRCLAFGEIGIALGQNNCFKNQTNNYRRDVAAAQRGKRSPVDAERQTPNKQR